MGDYFTRFTRVIDVGTSENASRTAKFVRSGENRKATDEAAVEHVERGIAV